MRKIIVAEVVDDDVGRCEKPVRDALKVALDKNEHAILELLAIKPLSYFPPLHLSIAERLSRRGLLNRRDDIWYPTGVGLQLIGQSLQ